MFTNQTSQTACGGSPALNAPTPVQLSPVLQDYLSDPALVHEARMMLRSWFMSEVLHGNANEERIYLCDTQQSVYFYEMLDEFLSELVYNAIPARV